MAGALPNKETVEGNDARRSVLGTLGVRLRNTALSHDQLDAAIGAVTAAAFDGRFNGLSAELVGDPLVVDDDGVLREGPIAQLTITTGKLRERVARAAGQGGRRPLSDAAVRAEELHEHFAKAANGSTPVLATYSWIHSRLFAEAANSTQSLAAKVLGAATRTSKRHVGGLGPVSLDTFIVTASNRVPGDGHWASATYDASRWTEKLGHARVLHADELAPWESAE
jgi:hypothetical protein